MPTLSQLSDVAVAYAGTGRLKMQCSVPYEGGIVPAMYHVVAHINVASASRSR